MLLVGLAVNATVLLLACIGMMVIFMGGEGYLPVLLVLLVLSIPVSLGSVIVLLAGFMRRNSHPLAHIWRQSPQWLVVSLALMLALIFCGELALYITLWLAEEAPAFWQHLPLITGTLSAAACWMIAVRMHEKRQGG